MHEWFFATGVLFLAAICGAGVIAPLAARLPFALLAAPLAGILIVPMGANALYVLLAASYLKCAIFSAVLCAIWTGAMFGTIRHFRAVYWLPIAVPIVAVLAVLLMDGATLGAGGPAIAFIDGQDQAGYAQLADWLNSHTIQQQPRAEADRPYEFWPAEMFRRDPRFGSFGLLAILSTLHGTSGIFTYDIAAAVVLAAGCLALAAVYGGSWRVVLLLVLGFLTSQWFDDAHMGYFGKLIAYPSALFLAGLALNCLPAPTAGEIFCLAIIAAGVGIMHAGMATSLLIAFLFLPALAMWAFSERAMVQRSLPICGLVLLVPAAASGLLSRLSAISYHGTTLVERWWFILPRVFDLESHADISGLPPGLLDCFIVLSAGIAILSLAIAIRRRAAAAVGLLLGPLLLFVAFYCLHNRNAGFQLVGWIYPATLCGIGLLLSATPPAKKSRRHLLVFLLIISIGLRLPRAWGAVNRYSADPQENSIYTASEMDRIADEVGSKPVLIEVDEPVPALLLLIETGRRKMNVQWSPIAWDIVVYRSWPWQPSPTPADAVIRLSRQRVAGHQFDVLPKGE
jgi:hypothetical protein